MREPTQARNAADYHCVSAFARRFDAVVTMETMWEQAADNRRQVEAHTNESQKFMPASAHIDAL